jgi:hypothetical protein
VDDEQRKDWDRLIRTLGAGYLVRWDQHDPDSLEEEVGPMTGERAERERERERERELVEAWFG